MDNQLKNHWEKVYATKRPEEVSWTQEIPQTSLSLIHDFRLPKSEPIIDIGGGDSRLVDFLLQEGFEDITVLDISAAALQRAKERLGDTGDRVQWIESDIREFSPERRYSLWHDRATFHFLVEEKDVHQYHSLLSKAVGQYLVLGTFSEKGPDRCSGLPVHRYDEHHLANVLQPDFAKVRCVTEDHITPFHTTQSFLFCGFRKTRVELPVVNDVQLL